MIEDMLDATKTKDAARAWIETIRKAFAIIAATPLDAVDGLEVPRARWTRRRTRRGWRRRCRRNWRGNRRRRLWNLAGAESPASGCVFGAAMPR